MTPEAALAAVSAKLVTLEHQGRQNSPEAIEFRAYRDVLCWIAKVGADHDRFLRILEKP